MKQVLVLKNQQRLTIMGRLRMADWIEMPERDFAAEIEKIEKDPLFRKLYFGDKKIPGAFRRQSWPSGSLSSTFYEIDERTTPGSGDKISVEKIIDTRAAAVSAIRRLGQDLFERYFLKGEAATLEEIARVTGLSETQVVSIHDFMLEFGSRAEFETAAKAQGASPERSHSCIAQLTLAEGDVHFEFYTPYWARGLYHIRHDLLDQWKSGLLSSAERRLLPSLIRKMETVNLRQNSLFRIIHLAAQLQVDYLASGKSSDLNPMSLRGLARRLDLSPSTVSRALARRSVKLPLGDETPLISLVPGRRRVLRDTLESWIAESPSVADAELTSRLQSERGIVVSRRTVNAVRHEISAASSALKRQE